MTEQRLEKLNTKTTFVRHKQQKIFTLRTIRHYNNLIRSYERPKYCENK